MHRTHVHINTVYTYIDKHFHIYKVVAFADAFPKLLAVIELEGKSNGGTTEKYYLVNCRYLIRCGVSAAAPKRSLRSTS